MIDYIIRGGQLINTENPALKYGDIAVEGCRIVKIGENIRPDEKTQVIDAAGCIVSPGLIDMHIHLQPLSMIGVFQESACFPSGVTTAVDAGSAGASNFELMRPAFHMTQVRTFAYLNISPVGLATRQFLENLEPERFDRRGTAELIRKYYGEDLLGLKVRQGEEIVGELGLKPLETTLEIAEELGVPVMVHVSNVPGKMDDLTRLLRKGDILTHAYTNKNNKSILDETGHVSGVTWEARERGVIFDVANANAHFNFDVARAALADGFLPDVISTDLTHIGLYRRPNAFNLLHVMSKYLNMGLTLDQVFKCVTTAPAKVIGHPELAVLKEGGIADIAVFKQEERAIRYGDSLEEIEGSVMLRTMLTMRNGFPVYRDQAF